MTTSTKTLTCPGCSGKLKPEPKLPGSTYTCQRCRGLISTSIYLGDSYGLVRPFFDAPDVAAAQTRYFDFICVGSEGVTRRHGWYNPATRLTTQLG